MLPSLLLAPSATTVQPPAHRSGQHAYGMLHVVVMLIVTIVSSISSMHSFAVDPKGSTQPQACCSLPIYSNFRFPACTWCDNSTATCSCFPLSCLHLVRQQYNQSFHRFRGAADPFVLRLGLLFQETLDGKLNPSLGMEDIVESDALNHRKWVRSREVVRRLGSR